MRILRYLWFGGLRGRNAYWRRCVRFWKWKLQRLPETKNEFFPEFV